MKKASGCVEVALRVSRKGHFVEQKRYLNTGKLVLVGYNAAMTTRMVV
jgi:hypothetical protein